MTSPKYIYFYFADYKETPLYIGQTNCVHTRFTQHKRQNEAFKAVRKIYYLTVPTEYTQEQTNVMESLFILVCKPILNSNRSYRTTVNRNLLEAIFDFSSFFKGSTNLIDTIKENAEGIYFVNAGNIVHFQSNNKEGEEE